MIYIYESINVSMIHWILQRVIHKWVIFTFVSFTCKNTET